jgi:hypothetical protein
LCRPCLLMNRDEMTTLYRRLTKPLCKMNWNLVGCIYGRSSMKLLLSSRSINKYGCHR